MQRSTPARHAEDMAIAIGITGNGIFKDKEDMHIYATNNDELNQQKIINTDIFNARSSL